MLTLTVPDREIFDESTNEFITVKGRKLSMEHSLVSISKWESKYNKPFLNTKMTPSEMIDYIKFMTLTQNVDDSVYYSFTESMIKEVKQYIDSPMTATTFSDDKRHKVSKEIVTSELIYYWMVSNQIPSEYQKWHLNRLLTLIRICSIKNQPQKKMSRNSILSQNAALNAKRRAAMHTTG